MTAIATKHGVNADGKTSPFRFPRELCRGDCSAKSRPVRCLIFFHRVDSFELLSTSRTCRCSVKTANPRRIFSALAHRLARFQIRFVIAVSRPGFLVVVAYLFGPLGAMEVPPAAFKTDQSSMGPLQGRGMFLVPRICIGPMRKRCLEAAISEQGCFTCTPLEHHVFFHFPRFLWHRIGLGSTHPPFKARGSQSFLSCSAYPSASSPLSHASNRRRSSSSSSTGVRHRANP